MNKVDLIQALKDSNNLSRSEAEKIVSLFFDQMADALAQGDRFEIRGLCSFFVKEYGGYIGRNPRTGEKVKERLANLYKGNIAGKGTLPNSENLSADDIRCRGCLSDERFMHCRQCEIRDCKKKKVFTGCHQCNEFPRKHIENFSMTVGKKVILRAIPYWREVGTEKWIQDEESRYICPKCGNKVFRGAVQCNKCKEQLDLD